MHYAKLSLLLLFFFVPIILFGQLKSQIIHFDSLKKEEFLNLDQQRLSIVKYRDSTVMLLRILSNNRFVEGLADAPEGYEVFIRSANQEEPDCHEVRLERVSEKDTKDELNISVVIDYSGSMFFNSTYIPEMQRAAQSFMDNIDGAFFTRINFDTYTDIISATPTQKPKKLRSDNLNKYGKATALYDAIVDGIETLSSRKKNKFVVVFTDGIENSSGMSANTVIDIARNNGATKVFGVSFGVAPDLQNLKEICRQTNYDDKTYIPFYPAFEIDGVTSYFQELEQGVFGNYYRLTTTCADTNFIPKELIIRNLESKDSVVIAIADELTKLREIDDNIFFGSIPFEISKSNVTTRGYRKVLQETSDDIVNHLKANPNHKIIIEGHASPDGEADDNWLLSFERANTVEQLIKDFIKVKYKTDIDALKAMQRITVKYYGHERPIFPVDSPLNPENRRVSIILNEG